MRQYLIISALIGLVAGAWQAVPDLLAGGSPTTPGRLRLAAQIGIVRSDLWTRVAGQMSDHSRHPSDPSLPDHDQGVVRNAAQRALRVSPLLSTSWLLLSGALTGPEDETHVEPALTMAFFTGPGEAFAAPLRLRMAAHYLDLTKPELCDLLRPDVRFELKQGAAGRDILMSAFSAAPPKGGSCIDSLAPGIKLMPLVP